MALFRRTHARVEQNGLQETLNQYTYDEASRFATIGDGTHTATYSYLANSGHTQYITYNNGTENVLRTTKSYDMLDRLTSIAHDRLIGAMDTVSSYAYTYNDANQRVRVDEVDGTYWLYSYDGLGQVTGGTKFAADGSILPGHDFGYAYDDIGNRTTATTDATNAAIPTRTESYTANLLNQYEQRTVPSDEEVLGSAAADADVYVNQQPALRQDELFYAQVPGENAAAADAPDVRIDAIKPGAGPNGEDIASTEEGKVFIPQTPEAFTYDADGNMTGDGRWIYTWNGENRLIQLETDPDVWTEVNGAIERQKFLFAYDHIGRRTTKEVYTWDTQAADWTLTTSLRFIYDAWNLHAELEPVDYGVDPASFQYQVTRSYVWGIDLSNTIQGAGGVGGLLFASSATQTTMPVCDGNGNVMQYLTASNAILSSFCSYSPFGRIILRFGDLRNLRYLFSTRYMDESQLMYYGHRYYRARYTAWINRDPIGERGSVNLYAFTDNDSINHIDILGMFKFFKSPAYDTLDEVILAVFSYVEGYYSTEGEPYRAGNRRNYHITNREDPRINEVGGRIYYDNGKFHFTQPVRGTKNWVDQGTVPPGTRNVGGFHTHPDCGPISNSAGPSQQDFQIVLPNTREWVWDMRADVIFEIGHPKGKVIMRSLGDARPDIGQLEKDWPQVGFPDHYEPRYFSTGNKSYAQKNRANPKGKWQWDARRDEPLSWGYGVTEKDRNAILNHVDSGAWVQGDDIIDDSRIDLNTAPPGWEFE